MKLKFAQEIQTLIDNIAALPDTASTDEELNRPNKLITDFENSLLKQQNNREISTKQYAKLRRQVSYLWEFLKAARDTALKNQNITIEQLNRNKAQPDKRDVYRHFVTHIKLVENGEVLKHVTYVKHALRYGVLQLSDYEVHNLINGNKVA